MTLEEQVNEVITNKLSVIDTTVEIQYGPDVAALINEILTSAVNNVIWAADNDIWSHKETKNELAANYPFLTEASKNKVSDIAAYFWK